MLNKNFEYFFLFAIFIFGCRNKSPQTVVEPVEPTIQNISGLWKLHDMKVRDTTTNSWIDYKGGMDGYLLYDESGHVALHLYEKGYEKAGMEFPNFNDSIPLEALKYITKSYYYMGNYKVLEGDSVVSHYKLSHSNPSEFGLTAERRFYFSGDTLIMEPVERKNANLRLKWLRN